VPHSSELGSRNTGVEVSANVEDLAPNTTYYYKLLASNAIGSSEGAVQQLLTLPDPPTVQTGEASQIAPYAATLNATVDPGAQGHAAQDDTTYQFQYSTDESFQSHTPLTDAGEGTSPLAVHAKLQGLEPNTTYHYRVIATNNNNATPQQASGEADTFTTLATPPVLAGTATSAVGQSSATIETTLQAQGLPTRWELQLGTSPATLASVAVGHGSSSQPEAISLVLEHLLPATTYYYSLSAESADGAATSGTLALTTGALPALQLSAQVSSVPLLAVSQSPLAGEPRPAPAPVAHRPTNKQRLQRALGACRREHSRQKRRACERQAHAKYRPRPNKERKR
jgi:phosphodiesterase/alkaline phosphatase D-like protein